MERQGWIDGGMRKCFKGMCGETRMDRWRNEEVGHRLGVREHMSDSVSENF